MDPVTGAVEKRRSVASVKVLENKLNEFDDKLSKLLLANPSSVDGEELLGLAAQCKDIYKQYSDINTELFNLKLSSGITQEANEIRTQKLEFKKEVKQFINLINFQLGNLQNISFDTSSVLSFQSDRNNTISTQPCTIPSDSDLHTVTPSQMTSTIVNSLGNLTITSSQVQRADVAHAPAPNVSSSIPIASQSVMSQQPPGSSQHAAPVVPALNVTPSTAFSPPSFPIVTAQAGSVTFRPVNPQYICTAQTPCLSSILNSTSTVSASCRPIPGYIPNIPYRPSFPPFSMVGRSTYHSTHDTQNVSVPPLGTPFNVSSHFSASPNYNPYVATNLNQYQSRPALPNLFSGPPTGINNVVADHILKNQLFQKTGEPFDGNPLKYYAWVNAMTYKMNNLNLGPWDVLTVLHENTTGKPKTIIQDAINLGAVDPALTLTNVWNALYDQFGTGARIASSIFSKLDAFVPIKSVHQIDRLRELINLSHAIIANMPVADELQSFNLSFGIQRLWIKLPEAFQNSWRTASVEYKNSNSGNSPNLSRFITFLERTCTEYSDPCYQKQLSLQEHSKPLRRTALKTETDSAISLAASAKSHIATEVQSSGIMKESDVCVLHPSAKHSLPECNAFGKKSSNEKRSIIVENQRCYNCLGPHLKRDCTVRVTCKLCKGSHTTVMHKRSDDLNNSGAKPKGTTSSASDISQPNRSPANLCTNVSDNHRPRSCSKVLLVDMQFPGKSSKSLRCYAIIDEQSSSSFVDPEVVKYFGLDFPTCEYKIKTLTGLDTTIEGKQVEGCRIRGVNMKKFFSLPLLMTNDFIPNCRDEVATPEIVSRYQHIAHLSRHFSPLDSSAEVLLLLGRDCGAIMYTRCFGFRPPYAHCTRLGWALVGGACGDVDASINNVLRVDLASCSAEHFSASNIFPKCDNLVRGFPVNPFCEMPDDEQIGRSKEDDLFLQKVVPQIKLNDQGNIVMPLPLRKADPMFPDNKAAVYGRSLTTLKKIKDDPVKLKQCVESMQSNIDNGHVQRVPHDELHFTPGSAWYIPVFCVTHPKKNKIRLVFDSAATYKGVCLNNELLQGPDINTSLATVLNRFRKHKIGFTADIESMFYAFHLPPSDCNYSRFFWWKNNDPNERLVEYRATRHIFGNKSSPSIANVGLRYAVSNSELSTERAREFVFRNFYVDDGCGSADTVGEAVATLRDTRAALSSYNIRLHKIASNSTELLNAFSESELADLSSGKDFNRLDSQRTLGVEWSPETDSFVIRTNVPHKPFTKRGTLATTNSLFDPLGLVSPVVLAGRLLQRFFIPPKTGCPDIVNLDWDDELPERYKYLWDDWTESLRQFDGLLSVPRGYYPLNFACVMEQTMHVFCDASKDATGCVVYLRSVDASQTVHVALVTGCSRVSPRKGTSIPRLELCAAVDATLTAYRISEDLDIKPGSISYYSDSTVVLGYIANREKRFSRYVTRRVELILKSSSLEQWYYIPTESNPGDLASRPQTFASLAESCWFQGPSFLWEKTLCRSFRTPEEVVLPEVVDVASNFLVSELHTNLPALCSTFERVDSWSKLVNVARVVLSFLIRCSEAAISHSGRNLVPRGPVSDDLGTRYVLHAIQMSAFPSYFDGIPRDSRVASLSPFVDEYQILRVGGRLRHSAIPYQVKFPILLPPKSSATILLIKHFHESVHHQGRFITTGAIRQAGYYILNGTSAVKKFINSCVTCRKLRAKTMEQKMSDLPADRLHENPPFTYSGMDVCGPFHLSEGIGTRGRKSSIKVWAILFICLVSTAVHVEVLPSLDISHFKNSLRRFFSMRGVCRKLRCDRGTNFVGAHNQEVQASEVLEEELGKFNCEWEFNPPRSSHFGGIWERSIGSIRRLMDSVLLEVGKRPLTRDELSTFLQEIACIINNTPMYEVSSDPNDHIPITPAQLMTLKDNPNPPPLETFTERDFLAYGPRRWRRIQALSDHFWRRWRDEYIHQLQRRQKWLKETPNLSVGDLVLVKSKNSRRNVWPMALVDGVKTSGDGLVRSVSLRFPSSDGKPFKLLDRPICDVVPILQIRSH